MPAENVVHRRIVDSGVDKDGLIFGKVLYQFRKLNDSLSICTFLFIQISEQCRMNLPEQSV